MRAKKIGAMIPASNPPTGNPIAYSLPRDVFALLEEAFHQDHEKAETFAKAIEDKADERIAAKKETLKSELYNELRAELATKEFVRAEINATREFVRAEISQVRVEIQELRAEIRHNALLLKVLIDIAVFGLTLFNPSFVKLVELLMK